MLKRPKLEAIIYLSVHERLQLHAETTFTRRVPPVLQLRKKYFSLFIVHCSERTWGCPFRLYINPESFPVQDLDGSAKWSHEPGNAYCLHFSHEGKAALKKLCQGHDEVIFLAVVRGLSVYHHHLVDNALPVSTPANASLSPYSHLWHISLQGPKITRLSPSIYPSARS